MATQGPIPEILDPMIDPRTGEYAVIAPGHTFKSVTQKIAGIVLTANTPIAGSVASSSPPPSPQAFSSR
jgi:hypothetical protein